jgi:uncharacterized protein with HEPN domain
MPHEALKFLEDARLAVLRVKEFTAGLTAAEYAANELVQAAVERQFEIIGEALNRISKLDNSLVERVSDHRQIIAFRNLLIHGYDVVDHSIVWSIIEDKVDLLHQEVCRLLAESA